MCEGESLPAIALLSIVYMQLKQLMLVLGLEEAPLELRFFLALLFCALDALLQCSDERPGLRASGQCKRKAEDI